MDVLELIKVAKARIEGGCDRDGAAYAFEPGHIFRYTPSSEPVWRYQDDDSIDAEFKRVEDKPLEIEHKK